MIQYCPTPDSTVVELWTDGKIIVNIVKVANGTFELYICAKTNALEEAQKIAYEVSALVETAEENAR